MKEKGHGRHTDPKPASPDRLPAAARHRHREQTQTQEKRTQPEGQGQIFIHFMHIYRHSQNGSKVNVKYFKIKHMYHFIFKNLSVFIHIPGEYSDCTCMQPRMFTLKSSQRQQMF